MKTLAIKSFSLFLLALWVMLHLPLNLLHHHEVVCDLEEHQESNKTDTFQEFNEELCFFCSTFFVKEIDLSSSEIVFSSLFGKPENENLTSIVSNFFSGLITQRAPPVYYYF